MIVITDSYPLRCVQSLSAHEEGFLLRTLVWNTPRKDKVGPCVTKSQDEAKDECLEELSGVPMLRRSPLLQLRPQGPHFNYVLIYSV